MEVSAEIKTKLCSLQETARLLQALGLKVWQFDEGVPVEGKLNRLRHMARLLYLRSKQYAMYRAGMMSQDEQESHIYFYGDPATVHKIFRCAVVQQAQSFSWVLLNYFPVRSGNHNGNPVFSNWPEGQLMHRLSLITAIQTLKPKDKHQAIKRLNHDLSTLVTESEGVSILGSTDSTLLHS